MAATAVEKQSIPTPTVARCAELCLHSFHKCVHKAASIHARELSLVEDQLARFSVWTANIRVFIPGRSSLDHRLREAPDVQDAIAGLLEALDYYIQNCSHILESLRSEPSDGSLRPIDKKFDQSIRGIANEISLLHKFSNTIRRASKETQNVKATKTFRIRDGDGNDAEPFLQELFANHIRDGFPGISDNIRQRLAITMLLRRKRILYRRDRYRKTTIRPQAVPSQPSIARHSARATGFTPDQPEEPARQQVACTPSRSVMESVAQTATTLSPDSFQKASSPSVVSVKTVALTNHEELAFPLAPCSVPLQTYRQLKKQREEKHRAYVKSLTRYKEHDGQPPPSVDLISAAEAKHQKTLEQDWNNCLRAIGEVTCPFCFYALPAQDAIDEKKWKLHVKNDLDAYVCLFEECDLAEELYSHSDAWLKHMRKHALRWRCTSKSHIEFVGATRDEYLSHMRAAHPGKFTEAQLGVLADRNSRIVGPLFKSCPLCGIEKVDGSMEDHIVRHLRFLALKSLPSYGEDMEGLEDPESQKNSPAISRSQSRSTIRLELERHVPVTFDEVSDGPRIRLDHGPSRYEEWGFLPNYIPISSYEERLPNIQSPAITVNQGELDDKWIQALYFEGMEQREQDIEQEYEGTCQWLLSHPKYCTWKEKSPALIFIKGTPGSGKSTLMKYALNSERSVPNSKVISFFFNRSGSKEQKNTLGLWRSLLYQILKQIPSLVEKYKANFEKRFKNQGESQINTMVFREVELREFFKTNVAEQYPVTIFIDALNECDEMVATELVEYFQRLIKHTGSTLNICFSCRHFPAFGDDHMLTTIYVEDENGKDILKYIRNNLRWTLTRHQEKLEILLDEISSKASGCFSWVNIVVSIASHHYLNGDSMKKILQILQETPTSLDQLYSTILGEIQLENRPTALQLMQWLYLAAKPLSLKELRFAMAMDSLISLPQTPRLHSELENSEDCEDDYEMEHLVRQLSGGLAEVRSQGDDMIVQLIHGSVNDFLAQNGLQQLAGPNKDWVSQGHYHLSKVCIEYATLKDVCERVRAGQIRELPFLRYAVTYWGFHMEKAGSAGDLQDAQSLQFVWPSDEILQRWIEAYRVVNKDDQVTLLHYCSEYGLVNAVKLLLEQDVIVECGDKERQTPLSLAAMHGHAEVVVLLLENGALADSKNERGETPLIHAAQNGHEEIVKVLLAKNVDIYSKSLQGTTPLWCAVMNGHAKIIKLLLDEGVKADSKDGRSETPLLYAAQNGYEEVVELLLSKKADIKSQGLQKETPLSYAAKNGHVGVMKMLLEKGAEADSKNERGETPLMHAARNGHEQAIELLITKGGDINSQSRQMKTPLWFAASQDHTGAVKLLLEKGVEADFKDAADRTPLSHAAEKGYEEVVELLLRTTGVDADSRSRYNRTPLWYAAGNGHEDVVKLLLEKGVDIDAKDENGRTPLSRAVEQGNEKVVKLLLERNADINSKETLNKTPLSYAVGGMMELLLEKSSPQNRS